MPVTKLRVMAGVSVHVFVIYFNNIYTILIQQLYVKLSIYLYFNATFGHNSQKSQTLTVRENTEKCCLYLMTIMLWRSAVYHTAQIYVLWRILLSDCAGWTEDTVSVLILWFYDNCDNYQCWDITQFTQSSGWVSPLPQLHLVETQV